MKSPCATLTGLALLCVTTLATARTALDPVRESREVKFIASDLQTLAGIAKLYRRIELAAKMVCHEPSMGEWRRFTDFRHCVEVAIKDAVEQVHSPALTALYDSKAHSAGG
jgi:UrcA family protein